MYKLCKPPQTKRPQWKQLLILTLNYRVHFNLNQKGMSHINKRSSSLLTVYALVLVAFITLQIHMLASSFD